VTSLGIDGCRGGWLAVSAGAAPAWAVERQLGPLLARFGAAFALIDIPIGLPRHAPREADRLARQALGPRRSSVFPVPCREAVHAADYGHANAVNRERLGCGLSRQSWNICAKIAEVDRLLDERPLVADRLWEAHPELCFARLAGAPLRHRKRSAAGRHERLTLLAAGDAAFAAWVDAALTALPRPLAAPDDLLDAAVLALAARGGRDRLARLPAVPPRDDHGLPMAIAAPPAR
jgi:predicted RNase H-like nuclease